MEREGRLEVVKAALRVLVDELGPERHRVDRRRSATRRRVVLGPTSARDGDEILGAIETLHPGGSTNLEAGLRLGYELARES